MKLSLWRQFSSNNSSTFTVVGEFASADDAKRAAAEIQHLLIEIAKWYEMPENRAVRRKIGPPVQLNTPLTPIEAEYSQKYDIEWGVPIDWSINSDVAAEGVSIFNNLIFVSNDYPLRYSTMNANPIDKLIEKLGGAAWNNGVKWKLKVEVVVPDSETASRLFADIQIFHFEDGRLHAQIGDISVGLIAVFRTVDEENTYMVYHFTDFGYISRDLPKFVEYLKGKGCTEVQYQFIQ